MNEKNELHNRDLHISGLLNEEKVDIGDTKVDIESVLSEKVATSQQKRRFISIDSLKSLILMRCLEEVQLWNFLS